MKQFPSLEIFDENVFVTFSKNSDDYYDHLVDDMRIAGNAGSSRPAYLQQADYKLALKRLEDVFDAPIGASESDEEIYLVY
jgi:hypothetical protein